MQQPRRDAFNSKIIITKNWLTFNYYCFYTRQFIYRMQDSLQHDLVHCDLQPDGDVFFSSSGDVRYSNLKATVRGGRRHSISSFGNYSSRRPLSDCMAKSPRAAGDFRGNSYYFLYNPHIRYNHLKRFVLFIFSFVPKIISRSA